MTGLHPNNPNTGRPGRTRCDDRPVPTPLNCLDDLISGLSILHAEPPIGRPNANCGACRKIHALPNHVLAELPAEVRKAQGIGALLSCGCSDPACHMKEPT